MKTQEKNGNRLISFELAAVFIFSLVLLAHLSVVRFASGYYDHFGVTLSDINFSPRLYDYVNITLPAFIGAGVLVAITALFIQLGVWFGDFVGSKSKPNKWLVRFVKKRQGRVSALLNILDKTFRVVFWGVLAAITIYSVGSISYKLGSSGAQSKTSFSSISKDGENLQKLIIYKNDTGLVLRTYDLSKRKFVDGYEFINGASYTTRPINL
jgi:hypothetical protein